jgi:hypothetical protein
MIFDTDQLYDMTGEPLTTVDVYLIAQVEFVGGIGWPYVCPGPVFKVGYSANPFLRLAELKVGSAKNLALFGVILCADETTAQATEVAVHGVLAGQRGRGEWFSGDVEVTLGKISERFPVLWLTRYYLIDLDLMRLVPFKRGVGASPSHIGFSDAWHWYADIKSTGVVPYVGWTGSLVKRQESAKDVTELWVIEP